MIAYDYLQKGQVRKKKNQFFLPPLIGRQGVSEDYFHNFLVMSGAKW